MLPISHTCSILTERKLMMHTNKAEEGKTNYVQKLWGWLSLYCPSLIIQNIYLFETLHHFPLFYKYKEKLKTVGSFHSYGHQLLHPSHGGDGTCTPTPPLTLWVTNLPKDTIIFNIKWTISMDTTTCPITKGFIFQFLSCI